jgi:conjugative relaxase-like TrwC/TraI family protein
VAGFDVLFTTSKSVSLLYGLTDDPALRAGIEEEWEASVEEAVAHFIDPHLSWSRSGHASSGPDDPYPETLHDVPTSGIVAGAFRHRAGRAGDGHGEDPLLHTHLVITNVTHSLDGVWRAHESTEVYRIGKAAYALQASAFRARLARRFGIQWTTPVNGHAEIRGLDRRDWIEAFSTRSDDANLALESAGLTEAVGKGPSAARDFAGSATKHRKESGRSTAELVAEWQGRAAELGLTPEAVRAVLNQGRPGPDRITDKRAVRMAEQLTEQSNVFSILDAMEVVAGTSTQGLTVERSMELARELLHGATDEIVPLGKVHELGRRDVIRLADGRVVPMRGAQRGEAAERYTTREILTLESRVVREAHERRLAGVAIVGGQSVAKALADHPDLGRDQVAMIVGLLTDGSGVSVVRAPAGFGKSYALRTAKEGWEADGVPVMATAHMRATATKLGRDVGLVPKAAQNIAALRVWLEAPAAEGRVRLPHGVVLLVDESSVVDLRDLAALERHVSSVSGKLVLVGDPAQLGSIGPAAPLNELPKHVPTYDLVENRRQVEAWEQAALHDLRAGQVAAAVNAYETHGAIKYAKGEGRAAKVELMNDAARDYLDVRDQGKTVVLMAATNRDRKALNAVIRSELVRAGEVADEGMKVGDLEVAVGDTLQVLKNSPQFGVSNTDVVKVQMVDKHRRTALVERPDGESVEFSRSFLAKNVAYGHAQTGHKAQGGTWDVALILADAGVLSAQWGYTALTRGAERNRLYFSGPRPVDEMHHQPDEEVPDPDLQREQIIAGLSRDRSEALATEVIAALDQDGRLAAQGLLASAADSSRVAAQRAASDEAAARTARQVATTTRDEEVESLERQRRELDAELGEYDRDRGPTRRR